MTHKASIYALALALAAPAPLGAHPHVFIDAGLGLVFDMDGRLAAVRVSWAYDEFYSMLMIEDFGLDADGDGVPEPGQLAGFAGKDVDWQGGFPGDLHVAQEGRTLALGPAMEHQALYHQGRIVTSHLRPLFDRVAPEEGAVSLQVYDPTFFVAYDVSLGVRVHGREGCDVAQQAADLDAAAKVLEEALAELDPDDLENEYPEVGWAYADTFFLTCAAGS